MYRSRDTKQHLLGCSFLLLALLLLAAIPVLPAASVKTVELPIFDKTDKNLLVAFVGYPGCHTSCPASLQKLKIAYQEQAKTHAFDVMLINVQLGLSTAQSQSFVRAFHPNFLAYSITQNERELFYNELGIQAYFTSQQASQHPGYIYVFKRIKQQWQIHRMYKAIPQTQELIKDINAIMITA